MKPESWHHLSQIILDEYGDAINGWEKSFLESFVNGRWMSPTDRQLDVFGRLAGRFELEFPSESEMTRNRWS